MKKHEVFFMTDNLTKLNVGRFHCLPVISRLHIKVVSYILMFSIVSDKSV